MINVNFFYCLARDCNCRDEILCSVNFNSGLYCTRHNIVFKASGCFLGFQNFYTGNRPIVNMATISPKKGFSVATVDRGWLPLFTCAVAGKPAASLASFPLNSTKISQFSSLKKF